MGSAVIAVPASRLRRWDGVNAARGFQPLLPPALGQKLLRGTLWGDGHRLFRGRKVLVVVGQEQGSVQPCPAGARGGQKAVLLEKQFSCRDTRSETVSAGEVWLSPTALAFLLSRGYIARRNKFLISYFLFGKLNRSGEGSPGARFRSPLVAVLEQGSGWAGGGGWGQNSQARGAPILPEGVLLKNPNLRRKTPQCSLCT